MKKFVVILFLLFLVCGCRKTDSILFKNEYESLNNNSSYLKVSIPSDNPFVYISDELLYEKINNKEDLVVLFGYSKSNDTRLIINSLLDTCKELDISKLYYLDILDIRDEKDIDDNKNIITKKEGSIYYNKIIDLLDENISEYIVKNEIVGNRIYAPSILVIKNKNISFQNIKSYMETEEEKNTDINNQINELLKEYNINTCDNKEC